MATKNYTDKFKLQKVNLVKNGRLYIPVATEYGIAESTVYTRVKNNDNSGPFKSKDNLNKYEKDLIKLRKKLKKYKWKIIFPKDRFTCNLSHKASE